MLIRILLTLGCLFLMGSVTLAETWEAFLKLKAADERWDAAVKDTPSIKTKDVIIRDLLRPDELEAKREAVFPSNLILFGYGSWTIRQQSHRQLKEIAEALRAPALRHVPYFYVDGHTCSIGSDANNLRLSRNRAHAVVSTLVRTYGISRDRLRPRGFGESRAIAPNETRVGRRLNRRVVLKPGPPGQTYSHPVGPPMVAPRGRKALIIGIEEYSDDKLTNLNGVRNDVRILMQALTANGIFSRNEILTLTDREATKEGIVRKFRQWLVEGTRPGDLALFYFSGHGVQVWDRNGDEVLDGRDEALVCSDTVIRARKVHRSYRGIMGSAFEPHDIGNVLLDDEIAELLRELNGRTIIFISDSCHSGTVHKAMDPFFVRNKTPEQPVSYKSVFDERVSTPAIKGLVSAKTNMGSDLSGGSLSLAVFTASQDGRPSQIVPFHRDPKGEHSVFTWHLYHGLNGKADLNRDGNITLGELASYVKSEVQSHGFNQVPQHEFQPVALARVAIVSEASPEPQRIARTERIPCHLRTGTGLTNSEADKLRSEITRALPRIHWTSETTPIVCLVTVEKRGGSFAVRLSDSTGTYWEPHVGSTMAEVLPGLIGNIRAYVIQTEIADLRNRAAGERFHLAYAVKGPKPRATGEAVDGDTISFRAAADTQGYAYILNVDTLGVIHPLYPEPHHRPGRVSATRIVELGSEGAFKIKPPFGREMIVGILLNQPSARLTRLWGKDKIGCARDRDMKEQQRFLDALWDELVQSGSPRGTWTSCTLFLTSFRR